MKGLINQLKGGQEILQIPFDRLILLFVFCAAYAIARAQQAAPSLTTFEVASVKVSDHRDNNCPACFVMRATRSGFSATNITLRRSIQWAYSLPDSEIVGPSWMSDLVFDIDARTGREVPNADLRVMMQALLADRFRLTFHRQLKSVAAYSLTAGKKPKLLPPTTTTKPGFQLDGGVLTYHSLTMAEFGERLTRAFQELEHRPVINETGIEGKFDFSLKLGDNNVDARKSMAEGEPSIFQVVSTDLGLTLKKILQPKEIIVVDHAERIPTAN